MSQWSSYQEAIFANIREGKGHTVVLARAGCIAGEAMIGINRAGKGFALKLSEVVRRFNGGAASGKTWDKSIDTYVRAPFYDGTVRLAKIEGAQYSGKQKTRIVKVDGRKLRATLDHRFLTPEGWVQLVNLRVGSTLLLEETSRGRGAGQVKKRNYLSRDVPFHPHAVNRGAGRRKVPTHRLQIEAQMNALDLEAFVWRLQASAVGLTFLREDEEVHHKDNNPQNNSLSNLEVLHGMAHKKHHYGDGAHLRVKLVEHKITSIKDGGKVKTYDLTVPGPDAFMAEGIAVHNSGKTTTIMEGLKHMPPKKKAIMVAFNKKIANELADRAPAGVEVSTLHSYGLRTIKNAFGNVKVDAKKTEGFIKARIGDTYETYELRRAMEKAVSLAKANLIGLWSDGGDERHHGLKAKAVSDIDALIDSYSIDIGAASRDTFISNVMAVLSDVKNQTNVVDFDDMVWFPVVHNMTGWQFDRVFVDETQDLTANQIELALMMCKPNGRITCVGDDRQAIYAFRGADSNAVTNIIQRLAAKVMKLTVCYRCASSIVALAQTVVPDFEPSPSAIEGKVTHGVTPDTMMKNAGPGDFILSRANAPLVSLCWAFIREGRPATIQGRDFATALTSMIKKARKAKVMIGDTSTPVTTVDHFLAWLEDWETVESQRLVAKKRDDSAITDKAECLRALCEGTRSLDEVVAKAEQIFGEADNDAARIVLSSTHKAKGLERDRVWVLADTYRKRPGIEEDNLYYVAVTRAKCELYLVSGIGGRRPRGN